MADVLVSVIHAASPAHLVGATIESTSSGVMGDGFALDLRQSITGVVIRAPGHVAVADAVAVASLASVGLARPRSDAAAVGHAIGVAVDRKRATSQALTWSGSVTSYVIPASATGGSTLSSFVDPAVLLVYHALTPGRVRLTGTSGPPLTIKKPDFQDRDSYDARRIYRGSRGLGLNVYRARPWPTTEVLDLSWSFLGESDRSSLLDFVAANLGASVTLLDHLGRSWTGFILNAAEAATQGGRADHRFRIQLQVIPPPTTETFS